MTASHDKEFQGSFFGFSMDGVEVGLFSSVSGLSLEFDVAEIEQQTKEGKKIVKKIPGRPKYSEVVLKRGYSADKKLYEWFDAVVKADAAVMRKTGSIIVYNRNHAEVGRFNIDKAWPSKISATDLSAGSDEVVIEEVTIQHEFLDWV
jgi:phage tail-like protein